MYSALNIQITALTLLVSLFSISVNAKTFKNSYLTFELPDSWSCQQEGTEWICSPVDSVVARDALIILSAKEAGPEDSFASYQSYLSQPRLLQNSKNIPKPSKVIHSKTRNINEQQWIEGLHLNSEIEGFYTLYLATVKQGLAVLVSLSAEKNKASQFNSAFSSAVKSIRLTTSNELLSALDERKSQSPQEPVGIPAQIQDLHGGDNGTGLQNSLVKKEILWGVMGILFIVVLYLGITTFLPKKKRRKKR